MDVHIFTAYLSLLFICISSTIIDDNLFKINWISPETLTDDMLVKRENIIMTNHNRDKYSCSIPIITEESDNEVADYTGPSEIELLVELFEHTQCSLKVDSYWVYELCHGKHLRQYHEQPQEQVQEFFLGKGGYAKDESKHVQKKIRIEEDDYEIYGVPLNSGTNCDLTGRNREVMVYYLCDESRTAEIYSLKEVATCTYELIVITDALCKHPKYKTKKSKVNEIECQPLKDAPRKGIIKNEIPPVEEPILSPIAFKVNNDEAPVDIVNLKLSMENLQNIRTVEGLKQEILNKLQAEKEKQMEDIVPENMGSVEIEENKSFIKEFVSGESCIHGGVGWWKHELCLGQKVVQYHEGNKGNRETIINLGTWNQNLHHAWLLDNPSKAPTKESKHLSLFYSNGDRCDVTGENRQTEVKLKCKTKGKSESVSIFLMEVKTCEYILVVESWKLCSLIEMGKGPNQFDNIDL